MRLGEHVDRSALLVRFKSWYTIEEHHQLRLEPVIDFFVSYTQADRAWAEWIAWVLEEAGSKVRIQAWDFQAGNNFVVEMHRAASDAERTLAVLSPDYEKSLFGMAEWAAALAQDPSGEKGKLLPVRVREMKPDGLLRSIVYIDLVGLDEPAARERLLKGLARGRAKPAEKPSFPGGPRPRFPGEPIPPPDPEEAQAQLRSLPEDEIPEPGPLPPGSHMPLSRNPLFVGREDDLRTLARSLKAGETAAVGQIAAATGLGGIGKTQLASEFVHRYGRFFAGGVFWMSFADESAVAAEVVSSGRGLGLDSDYDNLPLEQQVRLVEGAWESPLPRLLVFDNCEDSALLDRWRPRHGGSRVLVTSRRSQWDPTLGVRALALGTLSRSESLQLLRGFREDLAADDPFLNEIAKELGDLPLALHLVGSFLSRYCHAPFGQPAAYLHELRRGPLLDHVSLKGKGLEISPTGHELHIARTFALSFERLNPEDSVNALARVLLARAAHFAPGEPIPRFLLFATTGRTTEDFESVLEFEDALDRVVSLGLLESGDSGVLVVHRLVAIFARHAGGDQGAQRAVEEALVFESRRLMDGRSSAPFAGWQNHLRFVTEVAWEREDLRSAELCNRSGFYLLCRGDYSGAFPYCIRALEICGKVLGVGHLDTAAIMNNIGAILSFQGHYQEALEYYEQALCIREKVQGDDCIGSAQILNNMGGILNQLGDYNKACRYIERALSIREKILGPEHPDTAQSLNFGVALENQGRFAEAQEFFERVLAVWERFLGEEHPETARSLNNLGYVLTMRGNYGEASNCLNRALGIREKILGIGHPDTAESLNNMGFLLSHQGDDSGARVYYERALAIQEKILGPWHPVTGLSLNNLGHLLFNQGDDFGARVYYERALAIFEKRLGPEHPRTKIVRDNLALLSKDR